LIASDTDIVGGFEPRDSIVTAPIPECQAVWCRREASGVRPPVCGGRARVSCIKPTEMSRRKATDGRTRASSAKSLIAANSVSAKRLVALLPVSVLIGWAWGNQLIEP